jgi:hypothetical protein
MAALPNLLVIGAMKCGTSSLHYYLGLHPEVAMSERKELNFFLSAEPEPPAGGEAEIELLREPSTAERGLDWYRRQFGPAAVRGESSVAYSFPWYPAVAAAAAAALGEARIVYLVREPLARMVSHHSQYAARDRRPLEQALSAPGNPYLEASRYATALAPFLERFGRESVLVVEQAELLAERQRTMASVLAFLGVDPDHYPPEMATERNVSAAKGAAYRLAERIRAGRLGAAAAARVPARVRALAERLLAAEAPAPAAAIADPELAARLRERLEPEIAGIERLSGLDLSRWRSPG